MSLLRNCTVVVSSPPRFCAALVAAMPEPGQMAMMGAVLVLALLSLKDMQPGTQQPGN